MAHSVFLKMMYDSEISVQKVGWLSPIGGFCEAVPLTGMDAESENILTVNVESGRGTRKTTFPFSSLYLFMTLLS